MSGGEYGYAFLQLEQFEGKIPVKGCQDCASPELRQAFKDHLSLVVEAMKAIEWNDSGDADDKEEMLIKQCLGIK
jgi:hypothetical protein